MDPEKEEKKRLADLQKEEKQRLAAQKKEERLKKEVIWESKREKDKKTANRIFLQAVIILVLAVSFFCFRYYLSFNLKRNCVGYLERTAHSNTVEIAKDELSKAISYLDSKSLNNGYTSIVYKTPDEDIGFWYNNLKASLAQLEKVNESNSSMEKSNLLLKLRETILNKDEVIVPPGLSRYPHNLLYAIISLIGGLYILIACYGILKSI